MTRLEIAKEHVENTFGPKVAKRVDTFGDGTFYVRPGGWRGLLSWFADFVVYLLGVCVGFIVLVLAYRDIPDDAAVLAVLGLLVGVPMFIGLFFGNGRMLGAVLTGTRLVRFKDGGRIGAAAWWAMLVRTLLFPLFLVLILGAMFMGGGGIAPGSLHRISIDDEATRRLHAAGFLRLDVPGPV